MSAGLRAAIIAVREFPPMHGEEGKAYAGLGTKESQTGSGGLSAQTGVWRALSKVG